MNIFSALRVYAGKWQLKETKKFSNEEIALVDRAEVVDSQYGLSVCFFMRAGGQTYIPLSQDCKRAVGDVVDLEQASLLTLSKEGENDIYRVSC